MLDAWPSGGSGWGKGQNMTEFHYQRDEGGIVTVTMDMTGQSANTMNARFLPAMQETVARLTAEQGLAGVIFASAKKTFFAGGDLKDMLAIETVTEAYFDRTQAIKASFRALEHLPVPVVAAINGAALGGGYELCLACNRRIVADHPKAVVGLPEVTLGLLPGGGGVVRLTALLGLEKALPFLLDGPQVAPRDALAAGLVDQVVASTDDLIPAAKAWIRANPEAHVQPWDTPGFSHPGGTQMGDVIATASERIHRETRGLMPAPNKILDIAAASLAMPFDEALTLETRGFMALMTTPEAKAAITTFFLGMQAIRSGKLRPEGDPWQAQSTAVIGAGMMGAGIAHAHAKRGLATWLKDTDSTRAEAGRAHAADLCDSAITRGRMDAAGKAVLIDRITPSTEDAPPASRDLIVEAVFEDIDLKERVIAQTWPMLAEDGLYGTNTSTLPISVLAEAAPDPARFIGLHFFSPVERMKVIEIVVGKATSPDTLHRAYDYVQQIGYLPIVVNDARGFFTSRVFATYLDEGCQLMIDGMAPDDIERAAWNAGMAAGPLAVFDEVSLILGHKVRQTHAALDARLGVDSGFGAQNTATAHVTDTMIAMGRGGRHHGGGFYDYHEDGTKTLWPGLAQFSEGGGVTMETARDRLLYRQAIETLRCLDEGVLRSEVEANLGGILAIGFPPHTGGPLQFIRGLGIDTFAARAGDLAARYGARFAVPEGALDRLRKTGGRS